MKKINKNIIVCIISAAFMLLGFWGTGWKSLAEQGLNTVRSVKEGNLGSIMDFKKFIDNEYGKNLCYQEQLLDINSVKDNLLNTRVVKKGSTVIAKTDNGFLSEPDAEISRDEIEKVATRVEKLYNKSKKNGADFLYVAVPTKNYYMDFPGNVSNFSNKNFDLAMNEFERRDIPFLNFKEKLSENDYFITDHHWTPKAGLNATKDICKELQSLYGFSFKESYCDIRNFNVKTYRNHFLGSAGKKVGSFFTWKGIDDIDLITPTFKTDLIEEQPFKNQVRTGDFQDTVLYLENIQEKKLYGKNPYATYSGGDFRLQIIKNNLNKDGDKVLLIRDSFACVVAPFLSLNIGELHVVDVRNFEHYVGDKINTHKYIEEINPDYVIVLYSGIYSLDNYSGSYDFE